jgi:hypothetical protein
MNQLSEDVLKTDWLCSTPALNQDKTSVTWGPPNIEKDTLIFGGIEYRIVGWQPVYSGDQLAMYKLQLRV